MGQKINPIGLRIGVNKDWLSRWFVDAKKIPDTIVEDKKIRDFINGKISKPDHVRFGHFGWRKIW